MANSRAIAWYVILRTQTLIYLLAEVLLECGADAGNNVAMTFTCEGTDAK